MARNTISLSNYLGVERKVLEKYGVFDATLGIDTKLFVDPKRLVNSTLPEFMNSRQCILDYFNLLIRIHRQSFEIITLRKKAIDMLAIPEPIGLSIGYGNKRDTGTSISRSIAKKILLSLSEILAVGIEDEEVMELLSLFISGFGPDSISDLTIQIIYEDFCTYTENISKELKFETRKFRINSKFFYLPVHPFSKKQIIFTPISFLRSLPVASSWDEIINAAAHNEVLRKEFNEIVQPSINKNIESILNKNIKDVESAKKDLIKLINIYREIEVEAYDLAKDERGYYSISPFVNKEANDLQCTIKPKDVTSLVNSIRELIDQFRRSIEDNGGNTLLYKKTETGKLLKDKRHREDVAQIIFYLIADLYCSKANILLTRESNAGLGPVDFSLGTAYDKKVLVEVKKSTNPNLLSGFQKQLKRYEESENSAYSFYVVLIVDEQKSNNKRISQLTQLKRLFEENIKYKIKTPELVLIDGIVYPSPSKL